MSKQNRFVDQLRRNAVALISLFVAISGLSYNTWRNEASEHNRNQRQASIELLLKLGELQQVVFHSHYDMDFEGRGNPRAGWALVLTIRDLAAVLQDPMPASAATLFEAWDSNWEMLGRTDNGGRLVNTGAEQINAAIDGVRRDTQALLASLD